MDPQRPAVNEMLNAIPERVHQAGRRHAIEADQVDDNICTECDDLRAESVSRFSARTVDRYALHGAPLGEILIRLPVAARNCDDLVSTANKPGDEPGPDMSGCANDSDSH
jgi:hypothetical protein